MPATYQSQDLKRIFLRIDERLRAIEQQLETLSVKAGVPYDRPGEDAPREVVELVRSGQTMDAIKLYRELTGADFDSAKAAIEEI